MLVRDAFQKAKWAYFALRNCRTFLRKEYELNGFPKSWRAARLLMRGFYSDKLQLYRLDDRGLPLAAYVGDFERLMKRRANGPYSHFLDSKILFSQVFSPYFRCPTNYGYIARGIFTPLDAATEALSRDDVFRDPALPARFVLKRVSGGGGKNIYLVERRADGTFLVNDQPETVEGLLAIAGTRRYLLSEWLTQGSYAGALFPHTVNTVRVVTMRDDDGPFVAFGVQRIGRECSRPTDNLNRGGLVAPLDLATGVLGKARNYEARQTAVAHASHPETGARIEGCTIPGWEKMKSTLLEVMAAFPGLRYVGWDVVVLDDGFLVLEGNSYPGIQLAQLHYPLKDIPRVGDFFAALPPR